MAQHEVVLYVNNDRDGVTVFRIPLPDTYSDKEEAERDAERIGENLANGRYTIDIGEARRT